MSIRSVILERMKNVAEQQRKSLVSLSDDTLLLNSGLDSLCIATLVADLDDRYDCDPFAEGDSMFPISIGDFIKLYDVALEKKALESTT
jgi:acyl carrier protein